MRQFACLLLGLVCFHASGNALHAQATQVLTPVGAVDDVKTWSYGLGYDIGLQIGTGGVTAGDLDKDAILKGLLDAIEGTEPSIQKDAIMKAMENLGKRIMARKAARNKEFLEANKKKDGVQVTESGLQYRVITSGNGASPTAASQVTVHYEGKLTSGKIFDSSLQRGQPATFGVGQVIPGWTEALQRMKVGDKWELVIPPEIAYGAQGRPPVIGPNAILVFQVELLEVK
jgi:FKBP-type peptidyl-prolyl cis-trans isomerase FklB